MMSTDRPSRRWFGSYELVTLLITLGIAGGIWAFSAVSDRVFSGRSASFDTRVLMAMRHAEDAADPLGPAWVEEIGRDLTALGGIAVLLMITATSAAYLALDGRFRAVVFVAVAVLGGLALSTLLKYAFDRPRPELVPHASVVYTSSFPSGHSMMSAVTYLTLGALLARVQPRKRIKTLILLVALLLAFLVGISRIYLGVHWPTDVLAGWTLGAAWAMCCWLVAWWLQRRGRLESDEDMLAPE